MGLKSAIGEWAWSSHKIPNYCMLSTISSQKPLEFDGIDANGLHSWFNSFPKHQKSTTSQAHRFHSWFFFENQGPHAKLGPSLTQESIAKAYAAAHECRHRP
jgi:hypothetical protein